MEKLRGKNALIAGANSGIGAALTTRFLEEGVTVYALDKNIDHLFEQKNEEYGENLMILQADVTVKDEIERSVKWLDENVPEINIFIYSVGVIGRTSLIDGDYTEWVEMLNVNLIGFCYAMKSIVSLMLKQNVVDAHIITINSVTSIDPVYIQELHFYASVDAGICSIMQGLRHELKDRNSSIKISTIYAGLVNTNLYRNSLGLKYDTPMFKTFITLNVDDMVEATEYILCTPPGVLVSKMVITPRGLFRPNYFMGQ